MRIPVVLASVGPHESSWIHRRGFRTLVIRGSDGSLVVAECECGQQAAFLGDGSYGLNFGCRSMKVKHVSRTPVNIDLESNGSQDAH